MLKAIEEFLNISFFRSFGGFPKTYKYGKGKTTKASPQSFCHLPIEASLTRGLSHT